MMAEPTFVASKPRTRHQVLFLRDPLPACSEKIEPHVVRVPSEPAKGGQLAVPIVVHGAGDHRPQDL